MSAKINFFLTLSGIGIATAILSRAGAAAEAPTLLLAGSYKGYGNIYSPEIDGNIMLFSGWYNNDDYPYDSIYATDFISVNRVIRKEGVQLGDPSVVNNSMYMTFTPDPSDVTQNKIAKSTLINGEWSPPTPIMERAWLPSAVSTDRLYVYYTYADPVSVKLLRATLLEDIVTKIEDTIFETPDFYPINVDVKFYDRVYYMLGGYLYNGIYSIGMWVSNNGLNFRAYPKNPIIMPDNGNIIARTPFFTKEGNFLKIYYAQQKVDWWTNAIYYRTVTLG